MGEEKLALVIAGAAKSGTTSLLRYLVQHPEVCAHKSDEFEYFGVDSLYRLGFEHARQRYFSDCPAEDGVLMFAKSVNVLYSSDAMARLWAHNPDVQIVISLRNPIDRAYSDYWYARRRGWEYLESFEEAVEAEPNRFGEDVARQRACAYLDRSDYLKHLARLYGHFEPRQVHIFLMEDLKRDPVSVCHSLFQLFPEIDQSFEPETERRHNASAMYRSRMLALVTSSRSVLPGYKRFLRNVLPDGLIDRVRDTLRRLNESEFSPPPMGPETRACLVERFRPHNARLAELLDRDLSHWNR